MTLHGSHDGDQNPFQGPQVLISAYFSSFTSHFALHYSMNSSFTGFFFFSLLNMLHHFTSAWNLLFPGSYLSVECHLKYHFGKTYLILCKISCHPFILLLNKASYLICLDHSQYFCFLINKMRAILASKTIRKIY